MRPRVGYVAVAWWQDHREQYAVDGGSNPWRLDPVETARMEGSARLGFHDTDPFFLQGVFQDALSGRVHALVKAMHEDNLYLLELCQAMRSGSKGIWTVERVNEMGTGSVSESRERPVTGYVCFEDEDFLHEQVVIVHGHNPWRLNPMQMARIMGGTRLGFAEADRFFWRGSYREAVTGRQKAVVWAVHGTEVYQLELYQPAQQGEGGVWAVEHVMRLVFTNPPYSSTQGL